MSMQDTIADMLTRIRNAQAVEKVDVEMPMSTLKLAVANVLKKEGYIEQCEAVASAAKPTLKITLRYHEGKPVISTLSRVSRSSLRVYKKKDELPEVDNGLGVAIVTTSKGVMSAREARRLGLGGEVLCQVS